MSTAPQTLEDTVTVKTLLIWLTLLLLAVFVGLNWPVFVTPTLLSLGITEVQAPLGLVMLSVTLLLCALFVAYVLVLQATVIVETRRSAKDLHLQRELADKAEASRVRQLEERINRLELALKSDQDEATRVLSAYLGEIEDKLDRALGTPAQ